MFSKILVAVDGSDHAEKAMDLACDLGKLYGAKLTLVNVPGTGPVPEGLRRMAEIEHLVEERGPTQAADDMPLSAAAVAAPVDAGEEARLWSALSEVAVERAKSKAGEEGVEIASAIIEEGEPAALILRMAKEQNADLNAMGSRGLGNLAGLVLGSVSHKVSSEAPCTVITVK